MRSCSIATALVTGLILTSGAVGLTGCSSLSLKNMSERFGTESQAMRDRRQFFIDSRWVRTTSPNEFLGYRRLNRMSPIVTDEWVIQSNSIDGMAAYDRQNGRQLWRLKIENGVEGGAELVGDKLYFGASNGQVYCVQASTGKVLWNLSLSAETLTPPTVEGNVVYLQTGSDVVYALDAETGKQLWLYNRQITGQLSIRSSTRPTIHGDRIFVGFSDGFVVALKKRDGGLIWERKIGRANRFQDVDSTPIIDEDRLLIASFSGPLVSMNLETGEVIWSVDKGAYVPATVGQGQWNDRVYYSTVDGEILILDKKSGQQIRSIPVAHGIATQPVFFKGQLVYGESEGSLVIADAETGRTVGSFAPGHGLVARPTILEKQNEAYFISNGANLYAMKLGYRKLSDQLPWEKAPQR